MSPSTKSRPSALEPGMIHGPLRKVTKVLKTKPTTKIQDKLPSHFRHQYKRFERSKKNHPDSKKFELKKEQTGLKNEH